MTLAEARKAWLAKKHEMERDYMIELIAGYRTVREAAKVAGCKESTVRRMLQRYKIPYGQMPKGKPPMSPELLAKANEMRKAGEKVVYVAAVLGISEASVVRNTRANQKADHPMVGRTKDGKPARYPREKAA